MDNLKCADCGCVMELVDTWLGDDEMYIYNQYECPCCERIDTIESVDLD
ncbi:MAG: hypothetical protein ACRDD7_02605 [Peptostreptococcaceae bacterium]